MSTTPVSRTLEQQGHSQNGNAIRMNRVWRGMTSKDLAERAEISPAYLSRIEAGKANPSLDVLRRLAEAMELPLDALLHGQTQSASASGPHAEGPSPRPAPLLVRSHERKKMSPPGTSVLYELLSPDVQGSLQLILVRHHPNEATQPTAHFGEESIFCLSGRLLAVIGKEEFILQEGDCLTFDCSVPHMAQALDDQPATLISAQTPPSF